jgi:hypothetical protein
MGSPPIYLDLIFTILQFEISSLMNLSFSLFQTGILQATAGRKIQFQLGKNPVYETRYFKLENCKNQVQIDRGQRSYQRWLDKRIYRTEMKFLAVLGSRGCREKTSQLP